MGFVDKKKYKVTPGWTSFITPCQRKTEKNLMMSCMTNTQTSVVWNEMCRCRTPAAARWTRVIIGRVQQCSMASCQTAEVEAGSGSSCMFVPLLPHSWVTYKKVSVSLNGSPVGIGVFECPSGYQLTLRFCCVCVWDHIAAIAVAAATVVATAASHAHPNPPKVFVSPPPSHQPEGEKSGPLQSNPQVLRHQALCSNTLNSDEQRCVYLAKIVPTLLAFDLLQPHIFFPRFFLNIFFPSFLFSACSFCAVIACKWRIQRWILCFLQGGLHVTIMWVNKVPNVHVWADHTSVRLLLGIREGGFITACLAE